MHHPDDELLTLSQLVSNHDRPAIEQMLMNHRSRLRNMVAARLDPRLRARVDPSDVVQEAFVDAVQQLSEYLRNPAIPLYPWLRQLAAHRIDASYQRHLHAQRRSVNRETRPMLGLSDDSVSQLAGRLGSSGVSPSRLHARREQNQIVRDALDRLPALDREVLILRFVEQLTPQETAEVLGISPEAVGMRRLRALRRLSDELRGMAE